MPLHILKRVLLSILLIFILPMRVTNEYAQAEKEIAAAILLTEKKIRDELERQIVCLAKNIYYEAGAESYEGKLAVATVTMNRVEHAQFPETVCEVVYQRSRRGCQFSWTCGSRAADNQALYMKAYEIAEIVLTDHVRLTKLKKALYFHNTTIDPEWTFAVPIHQIGNHIFYAPRRNNSTT